MEISAARAPYPGAFAEKRERVCFFTGHRAMTEACAAQLYPHLVRAILSRWTAGYTWFMAGGALGWDSFAAETVLEVRKYRPEIHLCLALPCRDQTARWLERKQGDPMQDLLRYRRCKAEADAVVYVRDFYTADCMRARNQYMVAHGSYCIAYWNGSVRGGTAQTVRMAQAAAIPVENLWGRENKTRCDCGGSV